MRREREASLALLEVTLPAVLDGQPAMEELVGFFPGNLKADEVFARGNGLLTLTTSDRCYPNHKSPLIAPEPGGQSQTPPRKELEAMRARLSPRRGNDNGQAVLPRGKAGPLLNCS